MRTLHIVVQDVKVFEKDSTRILVKIERFSVKAIYKGKAYTDQPLDEKTSSQLLHLISVRVEVLESPPNSAEVV